MPWATRRGIASGERETSAWTSTSSGEEPSMTTATAEPGAPSAAVGEQRRRGVGDLLEAGVAHREQRQLLGRPEAVLGGAQHALGVPAGAAENSSTTSTMCSSDLGPATMPSLVTCPTRMTGGPPRLASVDELDWPPRGPG